MRQLVLLLTLLVSSIPLCAIERIQGDCSQGGVQVNVPIAGGQSTTNTGQPTYWQQSFPSCTVTVYQSGTLTTATLFSDNNGTALGNPFTSDSTGHWFFYVAAGRYDVARSGINTLGDIEACDAVGPSGDNCGGGNGYNIQQVSFTSSPTFNVSSFGIFQMTLSGNVTSSFISGTSKTPVFFTICQNGTGGFTFAWPGNFVNPPAVTTVASACTNASFIFNGTSWLVMGTNVGGASGQVLSNQGNAQYGDSNLTYTPGTKALTDTSGNFQALMQDCGGQAYNVKCPLWGAKGDGSTNDQTAIQAVINAASTAGGGMVFFPHGTYLIGAGGAGNGLILKNNVTLQCADTGTILESPTGGNYAVINTTAPAGVSNVRITGCQITQQQIGSSASGLAVQILCSSNVVIDHNYIHDSGAADVGVDTNTPTCTNSSNNVDIHDNTIQYSHNVVQSTVLIAAGSGQVNVHDNNISDNLGGQLLIDCDGCMNTKINNNILSGVGINNVDACVQIEATSHNVADVQVSNNICSNIRGNQAGFFATITNARTLSHIQFIGNHVLGVGTRGEALEDFNGTTGSVSDVTFSGEQIFSGGALASGLLIWHHGASVTWGLITVSNILIDGCGTGDTPGGVGGCFTMDGSGGNFTLNLTNLTVNTQAASNTFCLYNNGNGGQVAVHGIICSSAETDFAGGAAAGGQNAWSSMSGLIPLGGLPTRTNTICNFPGAIATNSAGTSLATAGWICTVGSPNAWTAF